MKVEITPAGLVVVTELCGTNPDSSVAVRSWTHATPAHAARHIPTYTDASRVLSVDKSGQPVPAPTIAPGDLTMLEDALAAFLKQVAS